MHTYTPNRAQFLRPTPRRPRRDSQSTPPTLSRLSTARRADGRDGPTPKPVVNQSSPFRSTHPIPCTITNVPPGLVMGTVCPRSSLFPLPLPLTQVPSATQHTHTHTRRNWSGSGSDGHSVGVVQYCVIIVVSFIITIPIFTGGAPRLAVASVDLGSWVLALV